jgi:ankyrin repeat protein
VADTGATALGVAASLGHYECAQALLKAGANVNAARHNGATPLLMAAETGQVRAIACVHSAYAFLSANFESTRGYIMIAPSRRLLNSCP